MNTAILKKFVFVLCLVIGMAVFFVACSKKDDTTVSSRELSLTHGFFPVQDYTCGQSFTKDNVTLKMESSYGQEGDAGYYVEGCGAMVSNERESLLWLVAGRAVFDVSKLGSIKKITVTITDYCGTDCSKVILLDKNGQIVVRQGNTLSSEFESFTFDTNLENVHSIAVSGLECSVENITIHYES